MHQIFHFFFQIRGKNRPSIPCILLHPLYVPLLVLSPSDLAVFFILFFRDRRGTSLSTRSTIRTRGATSDTRKAERVASLAASTTSSFRTDADRPWSTRLTRTASGRGSLTPTKEPRVETPEEAPATRTRQTQRECDNRMSCVEIWDDEFIK